MTVENESRLFLDLTADVVSSYVSNNEMPAEELPQLIETIHDKFASLVGNEGTRQQRNPMVPIDESVHADYIICLEDGKKLKMLKRHLKTNYNMTPEEYRQKWGLSPDYPMVAPNYAEKRSQLAKKIGLGTKGHSRKSQVA